MANSQLMYRDFLRTLARRFEANVSYIQYVYGFDCGDEFEVAVCKTLRSLLPQKFGVCRGHVVNRKGEEAGDDIIIYDRLLFPTLRLLPEEEYSRKEWVPIEAVYAYIEAKHSINLDEESNRKDEQATLRRAFRQSEAVKAICSARLQVPLGVVGRRVNFGRVTAPPGTPPYRNPMYTMVLAGKARVGKDLLDSSIDIQAAIEKVLLKGEGQPDLVVCGNSNLILLTTTKPDAHSNKSHGLFHDGHMVLEPCAAEGLAFGLALCALIAALDLIDLGAMPWIDILNDGLDSTP